MMEFMADIHNSLNSKNHFTAVYMDFSNAFDTVQYNIILQKLEHVGLRVVVG